jgi:hypothetical protein
MEIWCAPMSHNEETCHDTLNQKCFPVSRNTIYSVFIPLYTPYMVAICLMMDFSDSLNRPVSASPPLAARSLVGQVVPLRLIPTQTKVPALLFGNRLRKNALRESHNRLYDVLEIARKVYSQRGGFSSQRIRTRILRRVLGM